MFQRGWRDYRSRSADLGWGDVMKPIVVSCIVLVALTTVTEGQTTYKVTTAVTKDVDFAQLMTYSWTYGKPALNKELDAWIVAAIDRELDAAGLIKTVAVLGDTLVTYELISRTDLGLGAPGDEAGQPLRWVGALNVSLLNPGNRWPMVRFRMGTPINVEMSQLHGEIDLVVMQIFAKYPGRPQN
jgi:hypothetical protein